VVEHMSGRDAVTLLAPYLRFARHGARLILITPQESGFRSDPTHVEFVDFAALAHIVEELGLSVEAERSFPFPRAAGRVFRYNEFVVVARRR
jgi:hypothetical protein